MENKYRSNVILTNREGEKLIKIQKELGVDNPSQLIKNIVNGEFVVIKKPEYEFLRKKYEGVGLEKEAMIRKVKLLLNEYNYQSISDLQYDLNSVKNENEFLSIVKKEKNQKKE